MSQQEDKEPVTRAPRNRTLTLSEAEVKEYCTRLIRLNEKVLPEEIEGRTINQNLAEVLPLLPDNFIDLLFIDPPYNLSKDFGAINFKKMEADAYEEWLEGWLSQMRGKLKETASI